VFFVVLILNFYAMALRLVDGGIPSFEWKLKRFEIPYSTEELEELKRKVEDGELDEKKAFKKRYEYKDDPEVNLDLYRKILQKLPNMPGSLVLAKIEGGSMVILEVFSSEIDLREEFKFSKKLLKGEELDRYSWLKKLTKEDGVGEIRFLIGRAA
jgi:hypothetical protein